MVEGQTTADRYLTNYGPVRLYNEITAVNMVLPRVVSNVLSHVGADAILAIPWASNSELKAYKNEKKLAKIVDREQKSVKWFQ